MRATGLAAVATALRLIGKALFGKKLLLAR
jgi:hypothetical protein